MKEIEILVEVYDDLDRVRDALSEFDYVGVKKTIDEYYYDPLRNTLKPSENGGLDHCLRLREKNQEYSITYKDDIFEGDKWLYSNEYETKVESIEITREIFKKLGLVKFIEINNEKETYTFGDYEIVIENVKDLGIFMEVEYCTYDEVNVSEIKSKIQEFINSLGISVSDELNMGKPEMYMKKHNIRID